MIGAAVEAAQIVAGVADGEAAAEVFLEGAAHPEVEVQVGAGKKNKYEPVIQAIQKVEAQTTGEIRVHVSRKLFEKNPIQRATHLFHKLGMTRTQHRNGVLLYVNILRHKFAIYGDIGIHKTVGQQYWNEMAEQVSQNLKKQNMIHALVHAVESIGQTLQKHFPKTESSSDRNELSDDVNED